MATEKSSANKKRKIMAIVVIAVFVATLIAYFYAHPLFQGASVPVTVINIIFLLTASAGSLIAALQLVLDKTPKAGIKTNILDRFSVEKRQVVYYVILALIVVVGISVRIWKFSEIPAGINQDGAMAAVDGKALADYGADRFGTWLPAHLYAWGYGQMSSLLSYLIAGCVKLFGFSTFTVRLPQLIMSSVGGVFFFLFVRSNFGKKIGLIAAAVLALNPWHIMQSRWALECNLLPHFFIIGLYFLSKGLNGKRIFIYISMLFFALCMYCYGITIYSIPFFLIGVAIYYLVKKKLKVRDIIISAVVYLLIAWPFILTMAINFFKLDTISLPFCTIQYFSESIRSNDILFFSGDFIRQFFVNLGALLNAALLQKSGLLWNEIEGFGTMYYFTIPFILVGIIGFAKIKAKGTGKPLALAALLLGVWVGIFTNNVNVNRINIIFYALIMFASFGIYHVITRIAQYKLITAIMFMCAFIMFSGAYFTSYAESISHSFFDGFGRALTAAEATGADRIHITTNTQYRGSGAVSEILTLYYDRTDAKYFQGKTNINNGKVCLPYKNRFLYEDFSSGVVVDAHPTAVYVIKQSEKGFFNSQEYELTDYDDYCVAKKKTDNY